MPTTKHPIQPLSIDDDGVLRFKSNAIVRYLLDNGGLDMNDLAVVQEFTNEDHEQFAQLIGYSLSGFADLSYVSDKAYESASHMFEMGVTEDEARIMYYEETLDTVREGIKKSAGALFKIHPDDLET